METFLPRTAASVINRLASKYPVVVIVGPRQVGKTSLVKHLLAGFSKPTLYLDLEFPEDLARLSNPTFFLKSQEEKTVILDEVQRMPELFPMIRSLVDQKREAGRFILLGSASPDLIRDTSESLAGRVAYFELSPLVLRELPEDSSFQEHWVRGGFPNSFLAGSAEDSIEWRINFIRTYLERDLPLLGLSADPQLIRRLWTMIAHLNGSILNMQTLSKSLSISSPTVRRYLDFLESAFLIRRLNPYFFNIKKRLVKSPKIYVRDTGILHALLNIKNFEQLAAHPALGNSWEAYVIQEISSLVPARTELYFYRTQDGTESDLVIAPGGVPKSLVEIKFSSSPKVSRGFRTAMEDLGTENNFLVCPVDAGYRKERNIEVVGPKELGQINWQG